ncbi:MAG: bisanhydrobacterioruberin hydratase CruF [Bacteroidota bacterium]
MLASTDLHTDSSRLSSSALERPLRLGLYVFAGSILFSLAGTLLLLVWPPLVATFGPYYTTLVKAPTWTYMVLLAALPILMYLPILGGRKMLFFIGWGAVIGGLSELIGTTTGYPFGEYAYTHWLGPRLFGHVPYFIPFSWFAMALISLDLARRISQKRVMRVVIAALFMVLWDVSLDPAMSHAFPFWQYPNGGFYYGMPFSNWVGWFVVSLVIIGGYEWLGGGLSATSPWAPMMYLLNGLFPFMLCLVYGFYPAFFFGALATLVPLVLTRTHTQLLAPFQRTPTPA